MKGVLCRYCGEVHWAGETCAGREAARSAGPGLTIVTDDRFCLAGKIYPGLNGNRPMESKKALACELEDRGLVHSSPREIRDGPAKKNDVLLAEHIAETYDVPMSEARDYANAALAGRP
jgi:hypothetical protein